MGQTISYSLTQFEVDELIELSNGCCKLPLRPCTSCFFFNFSPRCFLSPSVQALLILYLLILHLITVTQAEIEALYKRFRSLDRGRKVSPSLSSEVQSNNPATANNSAFQIIIF